MPGITSMRLRVWRETFDPRWLRKLMGLRGHREAPFRCPGSRNEDRACKIRGYRTRLVYRRERAWADLEGGRHRTGPTPGRDPGPGRGRAAAVRGEEASP